MKNEIRIKSPTQACRVIEQILKTCTNSTITIKANKSTAAEGAATNKRSNSISSSASMNTSSTGEEECLDDSQNSFTSSFADRTRDDENEDGGESKVKPKRVKYGPIQVKPRVKAAPTLATGRKSKDHEV